METAGRAGSAHLSEHPRTLSTAADPVAAFLEAHAAGEPVALATSGTSGAPTRVLRTTASWVSSFEDVARLTGLTSASRVWVPGPLSATMNLFAAVHAHVVGAVRATGPGDATHAALTPSSLASLLDGGAAPGALTVVVAGDALGARLHDRARRAGVVVHHYYGAAELSFVAWGGHADDLRPFPGVDVRVRDGEIWARSPYLCSGYDGPPGPLRTDADGFATVGDRGLLADGRLTVHGRPEAVTVGGSTVEPAGVEHLLQGAAEGTVVVVGMPHPRLGRVLGVVLTSARDHAALRELARSALDGARRPRLWFQVERLPTTDAGKVDRDALVSLVSRADGGARRLV